MAWIGVFMSNLGSTPIMQRDKREGWSTNVEIVLEGSSQKTVEE
jgi:hypothetical protein